MADVRVLLFGQLAQQRQGLGLPKAPQGFTLREIAQLPEFLTRLAGDPAGKTVYALAQNGTIYSLDQQAGALAPMS